MLTLLHNPKCSKSRAALALLEQHQAAVQVRNYLDHPLNVAELLALLSLLGGDAIALVRQGDAGFAACGLGAASSAHEVASVLECEAALMQRPILHDAERAVIARPPERVLELL